MKQTQMSVLHSIFCIVFHKSVHFLQLGPPTASTGWDSCLCPVVGRWSSLLIIEKAPESG